jgi:hypothetical protein
MAQKVRESLYELIKSLTKTEKRYFKVHASRHTIGEENSYVRLFDYLEGLSAYNEDKLFAHFEGEAFLNRFSITKKRLYDQVLASLDAFHAATSVDAQLYRMLHSADILFSKTLYDQCERLLRSAEKLALKYDRQAILLEIARKQKRNFENQGYKEMTLTQLDELERSDELRLQQTELYDKLWFVKSRLFMELNRKGVARTSEEKKHYEKILQSMPGALNETHGFDLHYLYNHIKSAYYFSQGCWQESKVHLNSLLQLFENHPHMREERLSAYFSTLTNLVYVSEKLHRSLDSMHYLKLLKRIPLETDLTNREDLRIKLFASTVSIELELLTKRGDFEHARKQLSFMEEGLHRYGDKMATARRSFIRLKMVSVCLGLKEWGLARKLLSKLLNDAEIDEHQTHLVNAQLMGLLLDIETGNTELFSYALKNLQRFLKANERYSENEQIMLNSLNKIARASGELERQERWYALFEKLKQSDTLPATFEFMDLTAWAESRWKQCTFEEIVRSNWERKTDPTYNLDETDGIRA